MTLPPTLRILGIRGLPAAHGGFETFAERLALHLVARGWRVIVYGQEEGTGAPIEDRWQGVERVRIPVRGSGAASTMVFDAQAIRHAVRHGARRGEVCLTLGYNTALFCAWLRLHGRPNLINMDGIEWARAKWGPAAKAWFWLNERAGAWLGDHLVADHPAIQQHLARLAPASRISMLPYGADAVEAASEAPVRALGLEPGRYLSVIARPEPENSLLEIVQGFSRRPRGVRLLVLGAYQDDVPYHRAVRAQAGPEVCFAGPVYERERVQALRWHSLAYVHGHRVGGTNPSLVEALGAGNAVLAHDNRFNRWVVGEGAVYFDSAERLDAALSALLAVPEGAQHLARLRAAARARWAEAFTWSQVLGDYEALLRRFVR